MTMTKEKLTFRKPILVITGEESDLLQTPNFHAQKVSLIEFGKMALSKVKNSFLIFDFSTCKDENQKQKMTKLYKLIGGGTHFMAEKNYVFLGSREHFQSIKTPRRGIRFFGEDLGKAITWAN